VCFAKGLAMGIFLHDGTTQTGLLRTSRLSVGFVCVAAGLSPRRMMVIKCKTVSGCTVRETVLIYGGVKSFQVSLSPLL
jgi:hypothetical protein